ncbi:MAG TPA: hypothetical protein VNK52_16505 [Hyphomicrobiaceae bacterium]|nr:hypothetical protein [Hyphomicrobiaceae bacterium]
MPFELVRALRAAQDRIAHGDASAQERQRQLLAAIGAQMKRADSAAWKDPRNARAAVIYVLSGGDPSVLQSLQGRGAVGGLEDNLVKGAIGYGLGRSADAELLLEVDARQLDPAMAGHVALVQSTLVLQKDAARALRLLDEARLSSPGTLIEEAALRRQAFLALAAGERDRFEVVSSRYLRRFGNSVYAASFRRQFATEVVGQKYAADAARLKRIEAIVAGLPISHRLEIYLAMAAEGVVRGKVEATIMAASRASELATPGSGAKARAELFKGAAFVASEELPAGVETLKGLDASQLDSADRELLDAALVLSDEIRRWPDTALLAEGMRQIEARAPEAERPIVLATAKALAAAQSLNSRVDQLLGGAVK